MTFIKESDFEQALIKLLGTKGWETEVIKYPTEKDLIKNWADILFNNNKGIDRLNNISLTDGEMAQILEQINTLKTPLKLNGFINGKTITIVRDNPKDIAHLGKEISLKIYDRQEIAAGESRYQIVQQPQFTNQNRILNDRRGDIMLLINGMPVIHIELKKSGIPVSESYHQIEKYSHEGVFSGLFSLVQVFVAMTPDETVYFANAGTGNKFNRDYYFNWANFNNEKMNNWKHIASSLLSIPMAHQLIGFYTVADNLDETLKVMRSYQYYAVSAISDKVGKLKKQDWEDTNKLGGYIWHTTGSGKTMTSFKSAQLIATSKDADKVIFLIDRIELGTQSVLEYRGFADDDETVQDTESTYELISKLKSNNVADTLIVTSIQKMSRIKEDGLNSNDIDIINKKRIVFIVDECHRSTFGDMLLTIKETFPKAILFGFSGTPILEGIEKNGNTTVDVFGGELHRYTIADGIKDKNVLGFDTYKVLTFKDMDIRKEVALHEAKAKTEQEAINDLQKSKIYYKFIQEMKMYGYKNNEGNFIKGIEDYIPKAQYKAEEHKQAVINDILENWVTLSRNKKFSAIFATSSIDEAIEYYKMLQNKKHEGVHNLNVTALFDPNIDNNEKAIPKEEALVELLTDYNEQYKQNYTLSTYSKFKKDLSLRFAHKKGYKNISKDEQIDLLIVVDQMLTGFDSKWINTLYLDKMMKYEGLIQAFSRTNRLFGEEKPFGTIKYYRKPHTMERSIVEAFKKFSGDCPIGLFVSKLDENVQKLNQIYTDIKVLFENAKISDFEKLPAEKTEKAKFAKLFKEFNRALESAKIQGFKWENSQIEEHLYNVLVSRYKELYSMQQKKESKTNEEEAIYDLDSYITQIDTGKIDADYMNTKFEKYIKALKQENITPTELEDTLNELHKSYLHLTQEEQKYAKIFLHEIESGDVKLDSGKTFRDYITEYMVNSENNNIRKFVNVFGVDEIMLKNLMSIKANKSNINEFGRFDELRKTVDKDRVKKFLEVKCGKTLDNFTVSLKIDEMLEKFVLHGVCDIEK
ncbi:MAG: HsdR family type I site-specific deoxyribonuclease [Lachnospiraceae bacterium]|jgi:type I restriction enzyme R subunit|nr:HsdR family type I site-specific deoxyribonuclease [Lachnospiraceae bacterium]